MKIFKHYINYKSHSWIYIKRPRFIFYGQGKIGKNDKNENCQFWKMLIWFIFKTGKRGDVFRLTIIREPWGLVGGEEGENLSGSKLQGNWKDRKDPFEMKVNLGLLFGINGPYYNNSYKVPSLHWLLFRSSENE